MDHRVVSECLSKILSSCRFDTVPSKMKCSHGLINNMKLDRTARKYMKNTLLTRKVLPKCCAPNIPMELKLKFTSVNVCAKNEDVCRRRG